MFEHQIAHDVESGVLDRGTADELRVRLQTLRAYARLQAFFLVLLVGKRITAFIHSSKEGLATTHSYVVRFFQWLLALIVDSIVANVIIEAVAAANPRMAKTLHAPGMLIIRAIPFFTPFIANFAVLKEEPRLHDVMVRLYERICRRLHAPFLAKYYINPGMRAVKWACELEWT